MTGDSDSRSTAWRQDAVAGLVVFLVALPLCLGVALASNAPLFAGLVAGVVGGIVVGALSGSATSVSGPAAGLTAVVAAQIATLGSFPALQLALLIAGALQIALAAARAGALAAFVPSSVIKGLLAAIGVILILKQIPHVVGRDADPVGDLAFRQPDRENTFSELARLAGDLHPGAAVIGLLSLGLLAAWDRWKPLKTSGVPAPLVVVLTGAGLVRLLGGAGGPWAVGASHLVNVPVADGLAGFVGFFRLPDFSRWADPAVYVAAGTLAAVASLETLLNLQAVDKLDPRKRRSPPGRELFAQGVGNMACGLLGGLPVTSVVVRGSVNIDAGARTRRSTVLHGVLLLASVAIVPAWLNAIPLSCLAAILLATGVKLVSPALLRRMWLEGRPQFVPFAATVAAIVLTDLLVGILVGMGVAVAFVLLSSVRRPLRRITERHLRGDLVHLELADQVTFLNRGALARALDGVPPGGHVLLDARRTDYIDPDLLSLIRDFREETAPARGVELSLLGFRDRDRLGDRTLFVVHSTRELQQRLTPAEVLDILADGNARFRAGARLTRDPGRQVSDTAGGQHPLAVVLSCIDSRAPAELLFDLGVGDVFSVRVAGNVVSPEVLGSIEYGCGVAGAKLVLVMGHTRCGAVTAAVEECGAGREAGQAGGHIGTILSEIRPAVPPLAPGDFGRLTAAGRAALVDEVSRRHVTGCVEAIRRRSPTLRELESGGRVVFAAALYDVATGAVEFQVDGRWDAGLGRSGYEAG